ncbi:MAG: insulinase family protein [Eubacterium sp.]|nr:insulinase family protein [Eubacterium sp.]
MNLAVGAKLCGFTVNRIRNSKELGGDFIEMTHDKTGAELCWADNKEENKLFSVAFKTLPEDSTGVFHILEHSVLCGSEKYPVKEPFVDLMRSSMNTFLNAITFPDKTLYPVSSRNERDFLNLSSVYLDAVFAPALLKDPNIFYQEGIHTELNDGVPSYKGVVFNEMKGATSGMDGKLWRGLQALIFPDNCYRFNSGGDPAVIPDLTYEQYVDTYKRYYHPSNSRFFLDGDVPLEDILGMINAYLEKYEKEDISFEVAVQTPVANEGTAYYEISPDEDGSRKAALALGRIVGTWEERTKLNAAQILCDVLAGSNEAPLKRAILSSNLADDVEMYITDARNQCPFMLVIKNSAADDADKILEVIKNTVNGLITDGIDKKSILASINRLAFNLKELPEPHGLYRLFNALSSWNYGGDPLLYLENDDMIESLRGMAENGGFEKLLDEMLGDLNNLCTLHMLPSQTFAQEQRKAEADRVQGEVSALTDEEREGLIELNEKLVLWQQTPDSPEAAATLPTLELSAVKDAPEALETIESVVDGVTVLYHPLQTNGIVYLTMYFPLTAFSLDEISKLSLLPALLGELPTEKHTAARLQQEIKTYIGSLGFELEAFAKDGNTETCTPYLIAKAGILKENLSIAQLLIAEILTQTRFDDHEKIKELLMQSYEQARQAVVADGRVMGRRAVNAHYSAKAAVNEATDGGYSSYKFISNFAKKFDDNIDPFVSLAERAQSKAIGKAGLVLSVIADEEIAVNELIALLPEGKESPKEAAYKTALPEKIGIRVPAQISFAVKGISLAEYGLKTTGSLSVASKILALDYLWNEVRVQGGAYGVHFPVLHDGRITCTSYRDPSPARTLGVYDGLSEFLGEFCHSGEDLDKYIISAVSSTEPLRDPDEYRYAVDELWFSGVTFNERAKTRREMLSTTREDLENWRFALDKMAKNGAVCVVGNDEALKSCDGLTVFEL